MIEVGDMLICVSAIPIYDPMAPHENESPFTHIEKGKMYRLTGLIDTPEGTAMLINGEAPHTCDCCDGEGGWLPDRFRKLPPAEPEFIILIRSLGVGKGVKEDA